MLIYLLEHAGTLRDLRHDVVVEDSLSKNTKGAVLGLNAKLLRLDVDVDVFNIGDTTFLLSSSDDPAAELIIGRVPSTLSVLIVIVSKAQFLLEVIWKLLLTSLHGFSRHIDGPLILLILFGVVDVDGTILDATSELIITASFDGHVSILVGAILGVAVGWAFLSILLGLAVLLGLASSSLSLLVLLWLLWLVLENKATELQAEVNIRALTTGLAIKDDSSVLDHSLGLWVLALLAKHKSGDETIEIVLELGRLVSTVDDPAVIGRVGVGLSTQFETEVLDDIRAGSCQGLGNTAQVHNDRLDAITLALNLGLDFLHLIAVEGVADIATYVDGGHICGLVN